MPVNRQLAAGLLFLAAAAMPQLLWLGAHALEHHEHAEEDTAGYHVLAEALVHGHGHEHADGVPDHEHHLLPAPLLRLDAQDLQAPSVASLELESPDGRQLPLSSTRPWRGRIDLSGSGPPRLHLLCTLLI